MDQLVDTCIKNGGDHFLAEIASKEFVDEMSGMIKSPVSRVVEYNRDTTSAHYYLDYKRRSETNGNQELSVLGPSIRDEAGAQLPDGRLQGAQEFWHIIPTTAYLHLITSPDNYNCTHMDRLGRMYAMSYGIHLHKSKAPLPELRSCV